LDFPLFAYSPPPLAPLDFAMVHSASFAPLFVLHHNLVKSIYHGILDFEAWLLNPLCQGSINLGLPRSEAL
jgi:hypothetical protein